ncbi:hypothetical protein DUI87_31177 [Hirundo rustica rustica]|uniref:Alcohol dehydrogenase-like C-terminal domain-containing protein n=1 Tax=Hirundo rustica rustica TaxID=333673 RepID=A0A3M0IUC0_HIRRU|nr:hypothetical protein DUI87_31177 [Hirundo rustica rustica]
MIHSIFQVTMKALYGQQNSPGEEMTFVFQERENLPATRAHDVKVQVRACALSWVDTKSINITWDQTNRKGETSRLELEKGIFRDEGQGKPSIETWFSIIPFGTIAIQLARHRGAKVISTAHSLEDKQYLERLRPAGARVIDVSHGKIDVAESCLEETGGLGVDIVLDAGVRLYSAEDEAASKSQLLPHKHDIITLLGVGGHWITTEKDLQCSWIPILEDIMEKLSKSIFRPQLDEPIPLYEAKVSMEIVQKNQARKRQVIQF